MTGPPGTASRTVVLPTLEHTLRFGRALGGRLAAGDLVILSGSLGAGKTALTQGIAAGMGVSGRVTSPTFVLARVHPAAPGRVALVHVDAYRLAGSVELDDLDLDTELTAAAVVVEWGTGVAEQLSDVRLSIHLDRLPDDTRRAGLDRSWWDVGGTNRRPFSQRLTVRNPRTSRAIPTMAINAPA